ncbi:MAG: hypothetical protein ACI4Q4_01420 [Oscillospiraceae bacterium]
MYVSQHQLLQSMKERAKYYNSLEEIAPLEKGCKRAYSDMIYDLERSMDGFVEKYSNILHTLEGYKEPNEDKAAEMRGYYHTILEVFRLIKHYSR